MIMSIKSQSPPNITVHDPNVGLGPNMEGPWLYNVWLGTLFNDCENPVGKTEWNEGEDKEEERE